MARPITGRPVRDERLVVLLTSEEKQRLREIAEREGASVGTVTRRAIAAHLNREAA